MSSSSEEPVGGLAGAQWASRIAQGKGPHKKKHFIGEHPLAPGPHFVTLGIMAAAKNEKLRNILA